VIATTAAEADGLATACMLMTSDDAMAMVESKSGRSVMLVVKMKGTDSYKIFRSPSFPDMRR
ncbi:MAG: hypothetical protein K2M76_07995, partial [Muribaculaceae bacterium]|nr:hypothetical protein [Muribaculaceae bacterium]